MDNAESGQPEPIAIVGLGFRFPGGAHDLTSFWEILQKGLDCIVDVPKDRWDSRRFYDSNDDKPGKIRAAQAGFLQQRPDEFDPLFFNISPREAAGLDPQQRWLLECAWEAFENAGWQESAIRGSKAGVFIGGFTLDNMLIQLGILNRERVGLHSPNSSTMVMLSNRISYSFDLRGPSMTLDTACSSSLVAIHLACQSIWNRECKWALAGGVNAMLSPDFPMIMSQGKYLSPESRSKAFAADASGYARGEGAGVLVLKPLNEARAAGDRIHALIRGTGCNQDGATNGISVPNLDAQVDLMRTVYQRAGINPKDVNFVEAHGTGTQIGDPIEMNALKTVFGSDKAVNPCYIGAVKTNLGHLEAAAGIAGVIKACLVLQQKEIPRNLHGEITNPKIPLFDTGLALPQELTPLPETADSSLAAVNSFGYGGTNAHVVLESSDGLNEPKHQQQSEKDTVDFTLVPVSARTEQALADTCKRYAAFLHSNPKVSFENFVYTLVNHRTHHHRRLVFIVQNKADLLAQLDAYAQGQKLDTCMRGKTQQSQKLAFVFTGMGPQWWGMGRELFRSNSVFQEAIEACDGIFFRLSGWSIVEELMATEDASKVQATDVAQPLNFALQVGLTAVWKSLGIEPAAVVGHSVGETASAYVSGALSLKDALTVVYHRSRLQNQMSGKGGAMYAVGISEVDALARLKLYSKISIAAVNSKNAVTLSGDAKELSHLAGLLEAEGIFQKRLYVDVAYHSSHMDGLKEAVYTDLSSLNARDSKLPLYSTVTGKRMAGTEWDADYWWQNIRNPVYFARAIEALHEDGYTSFLEVGPHPVLRGALEEIVAQSQASTCIIASLVRKEPEMKTMLKNLAQAHCYGVEIDWDTVTPKGSFIDVPYYPWERQRLWNETERSLEFRLGNTSHSLLNDHMRLPFPAWEVELNTRLLPWLSDHKISDVSIFPGSGYIEAALALHNQQWGSKPKTLYDITFKQMLAYREDAVIKLHSCWNPSDRSFSIYSREVADEPNWTLHAQGQLLNTALLSACEPIELDLIQQRCSQLVEKDDFYEKLFDLGLHYGSQFRLNREIRCNAREAITRIDLGSNADNYIIHPAVLDSAFQALFAPLLSEALDPQTYVPARIEQFDWLQTIPQECWCHAVVRHWDEQHLLGDFTITDEAGNVLVRARGLRFQSIPQSQSNAYLAENYMHELVWEQSPLPIEKRDEPTAQSWLFLGEVSEWGMALTEWMIENGHTVSWALPGSSYEVDEAVTFDFNDPDHWKRFLSENQSTPFTDVLFFGDLPDGEDNAKKPLSSVMDSTLPLVHWANAWRSSKGNECVGLTLVTWGTQAVLPGESVPSLNNSSWWGLGYLLSNESPMIRHRLFDVPVAEPLTTVDNLGHELTNFNDDEAIAYRDGARFVQQLNPLIERNERLFERQQVNTSECAIELEIPTPGDLESFVYREVEAKVPQGAEIQIKVQAASLNFKDVIKALGHIDERVLEDTYFGDSIGMECSGVVTATGEDVRDLKVGDAIVLATPKGCFCSSVTQVPEFWMAKPDTLSFAEAPILVPFMTAIYAFEDIARLKAGERVLIHNASGAVGLAAIQVAQSIGAKIYASAGSEEKQSYLQTQGIEHIYNSRTLHFADEILYDTQGYGVDVVLNAIAGESLQQSLRLLAPHGRFVEIGKRDIAENNLIPLGVFNRNIQFNAIDLDRILCDRSDLSQALIDRVYRGFIDKRFRGIPTESVPAGNVADAFLKMSRSLHIGKLAVDFNQQDVEIAVSPDAKSLDKEGSYLITGGTQGLGLGLAQKLSDFGVAAVVLVSRKGLSNDASVQAVEAMREQGTQVRVERCDVSDYNAVTAMIEKVSQGLPPLKGIIHGAMVLEDAHLSDVTAEQCRRVMAPKVSGAWNLHRATLALSLDMFVSLSSISSLIGNAGQAAYVAANAYLDAFSHYRRSLGLATTTLNLGVVDAVGVVARDDSAMALLLEESGIHGLSVDLIFTGIKQCIEHSHSQVGLFDVEWDKLITRYEKLSTYTRFKSFVSLKTNRTIGNEKTIALTESLQLLSASEQEAHIETLLLEIFAELLKIAPEQIEKERKIHLLGIDSLMAVELERTLFSKTGIRLASVDFLSGLNISQLAQKIFEKLELKIIASEDQIDSVDDMSESELDAMLARLKSTNT